MTVDPEGNMEEDGDMDGHDGKMDGDKDMMIWNAMKMEKMMEWAMRDPMMGQITYTMVAVGQAAWIGLDMFRYYSADSGRVPASVGTTDYAGLAHMIGGYGGLALWSVAAITQILSMAGIAAGVNMMVWHYGLEWGGSVIGAVWMVLMFLSYNEAYTVTQDTGAAAADVTAAGDHMDTIEATWAMVAANEALVSLSLIHI